MKKYLDWLVLLAIIAVVFIPTFANRLIGIPINNDSIEHIKVFQNMISGNATPLYMGQEWIGYPVIWISKLTGSSLTVVFNWFNYLAFAFAMWSIYFITSRVVNRIAGILAVILTFFISLGEIDLFLSGTIFNIVNMSVILLWMVYFGIRYWVKGNIWNLIGANWLLMLFISFHTTGAYFTGKYLFSQVLDATKTNIGIPVEYMTKPNIKYWIDNITPVVIGLLIMSIIGIIIKKIKIEGIKTESNLFIGFLIVMSIWITIGGYLLSPIPTRQVFDAINLVTILTACLVGILIEKTKSKVLLMSTIIFCAFGAVNVFSAWILKG